ncbi:MAG: TolC family protein [Polymorphobacter sp.]
MRAPWMAVLVLLASAAQAETGLPPEALVAEVLDTHPTVLAAAARVSAADAQARALAAGHYEVTATGVVTRRNIDRVGGFDEFDGSLTRSFRWPGKADLDRKAGALGVRVAQNRMADARHQVALLLNGYWWDWLAAAGEVAVDAAAVASLESAHAAVKRRAALRDAAALDIDQAQSALATAMLAQARSAGRARAARANLAAQFPQLPLAAVAPSLPLPALPAEGLPALRQLVIDRSHEIGAAQAEADRQAVLARRAQQDRIADPSFGVRAFSERGGSETGGGIIASMPFGGSYRSAVADQAVAMAAASQSELVAVRADVTATANTDFAAAEAAMAAWRDADAARSSTASAAARLRSGYKLGAIDLTDMLYAERQAQDAARDASLAQADALRALTRIRIDSHVIWVPADHDHDH